MSLINDITVVNDISSNNVIIYNKMVTLLIYYLYNI